MSVTPHTDIIRGTSIISNTQVARAGIVRNGGGGGGTPLEDAVNGIFSVATIGDYWKFYDYTTLKSDSGGTGDITAAGQDVGYAAGQRTSGTAVNLIQATAARKMVSTDWGTTQGITASASTKVLGNSISSSGANPVLFVARVRSGTIASNFSVISAMTTASDAAIVGQTYKNNPGAALAIFATSALTGTAFSSDTDYYISSLFDGASSEAWRNGVSDITGNPGSNANGVNIYVGGRGTVANINMDDFQLEKYVVKVNPSAGDRATAQAWCAVAGDA